MYRFERAFYWTVWIASCAFSLYCFYLCGQKNQSQLDPNDFREGWFFGRLQDVSDFEWQVLKGAFLRYYWLLIIHIFGTHIIRVHVPQYAELFFALFGSFALVTMLGVRAFLLVIIDVLIMYGIQKLHRPWIAYIFFFGSLASIHHPAIGLRAFKEWIFDTSFYSHIQGSEKIFLLEVCFAWINAKCLSYVVDKTNGLTQSEKPKIIGFLGYVLYFPALLTGPIHLYDDFLISMWKPCSLWTKTKAVNYALSLARCASHVMILEIMTHFIYCSSVQYYPELTAGVDSWTLAGLGYALPVIFYLKYLIVYGTVCVIARIDGIDVPPPPECISHVHSPTRLWRYFDRGLHFWLSKYFYKPIVGKSWSLIRRFLGAFLCFLCVCLWHGMDAAAIIWTLLNFLGVIVEMSASAILQSDLVGPIFGSFSARTQARLKAIFSGPFFLIMIISNVFFLSNVPIGMQMVFRFLALPLSFPMPFVPTILIMMCGCVVGIDCIKRESDRKHRLLNADRAPRFKPYIPGTSF